MPTPMSKLARALTLAATLATISLTSMTAVAQAHASDDPASTRHRARGRVESLAIADLPVSSQEQPSADPTLRRLLARERFSIPDMRNGEPAQGLPAGPVRPAQLDRQPGWLIPALSVLATVLALAAVVAVLVARHAHRSQRASQTA